MTDPAILTTEAELTRLSHAFAYCMDYHDYDQLLSLFTPDGVFDRAGQVHRGHDEIREGMAQRATHVMTRHISTNFYYRHLGPDEVRGVIYNLSYYGFYEEPGEAPLAFEGQGFLLEFHDRYVRTDGSWRFAERIAKPVLADKDSMMMKVPKWRPQKLD